MSDLRKAAEQAIATLIASTKYVEGCANARMVEGWGEHFDDMDKAISALKAALAEPEQSEPVCNPHPKAPHGVDRNGSHSAGRYVCDCESWEPYDAGYQKGLQDGLKRAYALQEVSDIGQLQEAPPRREPLPNHREVMQQALDALKNPYIVDSINSCLADDAIKALDEALK